jgi:hypothetical protein
MNTILPLRLVAWFTALVGLGLAGRQFFREATAWSAAVLAAAAILYVGLMFAHVAVNWQIQNRAR